MDDFREFKANMAINRWTGRQRRTIRYVGVQVIDDLVEQFPCRTFSYMFGKMISADVLPTHNPTFQTTFSKGFALKSTPLDPNFGRGDVGGYHFRLAAMFNSRKSSIPSSLEALFLSVASI